MTTTQTFVSSLYDKLLYRDADNAGRDYWSSEIDNGKISVTDFVKVLVNSSEYNEKIAPIASIYYSAFGRMPDKSGLAYWVDRNKDTNDSMSVNQIALSFMDSPEYKARYSSDISNKDFVEELYTNILGRSSDEEGKAYWIKDLENGANKNDLIVSFANSKELATNKADEIKTMTIYIALANRIPTTTEASSSSNQTDIINTLFNSEYTGVDVPNASGIVSDGYISGATVFADANGDGVWNEGEARASTNASGDYTLVGGSGSIVASGGTDISTGLAFEGVFTAPEGSTTVSPLTTLVDQVMQQSTASGSTMTAEEASANVAQALGIDESVNLLTFDPIEAANDTTLSDALQSVAVATQAAAVQVANIMSQTAATLSGAGIKGEEAGALAAANSLASLIVEQVATAETTTTPTEISIDLSSAEVVQSVVTLSATVAATDAGLSTSEIQAVEDAVEVVAQSVATATANINTVMADAVENAEAGTSVADIFTELAQTQVAAEAIENLAASAAKSGDTSAVTEASDTSKIVKASEEASETVAAAEKVAQEAIAAEEDAKTEDATSVSDDGKDAKTDEDAKDDVVVTTPSSGGGSGSVADTTAPTAILTYSIDGGSTYSSTVDTKNADTLKIKATFSEDIADATGATIAINNSILTAQAMTKSTTKVYTYDLNVPAGDVSIATVTISGVKDAAGNTINSTPTNATFTIDNTAPTATVSATSISASDSVSVQSSEVGTAYLVHTDVTVNSLSDITGASDNKWNSTNITSANSATNLSASGLTDGTYALYTTDEAGNLSSVSQFNVTIDATNPTITAQNAYPNTKTVVLTASETVTGTPNASDFSVVMNDATNGVTGVVVNGTSITLTLANTIQTGATLTVDYAQNTSAKITDSAGNAMSTVGDALSVTVESDSTVPTVASVTSTANNLSYGIGDTIPVTVTFSEAVTVTGTPQLKLETGTTDRTVDYVSGSGSDTLTFNYTVQSGDSSSDLAYNSTAALTLNSGSIKDAAGNTATLTLPTVGAANSLSNAKDIVIDGTLPTITVQAADAGTKTITLTTSENVSASNANTSDFTVSMNSVANTVTAVDVSNSTITLTLTNAIQNSSTLTVDYAKSSGHEITDTAGNAIATVGDALTTTVTNDTVVPTVASVTSTANDGSYKVGDTIPVTVTFSEAVTVTGTPQLTLETGDTDRTINYASISSDSKTLTFNYTVQSGDETADLDYKTTSSLALNGGSIKDAAGNAATLTLATVGATNSISDNQAIVIDGTLPTITAQTADAGTKTITLKTSESVTGSPNTSDFTVLMNSVANAVTSVLVSGTTTTLTLTNAIQNSSTLTVDYDKSSGHEITDTAGNAIATVGDALTTTVTNDTVVPTVASVTSTANDGSYKVGDTIPVTVTFSEAVTVTGTPQLTLETGDTDRTINYASISSDSKTLTFNYTVQSGDTTTDLTYTGTTALSLNSGTIKDAAGNAATLTLAAVNGANSLSNAKDIVIDGTLPTITAQVANAGTKIITLTTSESVVGTPNISDFTVLMNSVSNAVAGVLVSGTTTTLTLTDAIQNSSTLTVDYAQNTSAKITDAAGNAIATVGDALTTTVTNDNTIPVVSSVSSTKANGSYSIGDVIPITITFDDRVTVTGTPQLKLETGDTDRTVDYVSGSGSNTLTFNYTVQSGDATSDLAYNSTAALTLNSGSIKDAAGNAVTLTLPTVGAANSLSDSKAIVIDGVIPTIITVGGATSPSDGDKLGNDGSSAFDNIVLDFSEAIEAVSDVILADHISVVAPAGSTDQLIAFSASFSGGNLIINLDENDADITGADNQSIYINIDNNTLQDSAGNTVVGIDNSTDYNLYLSVI